MGVGGSVANKSYKRRMVQPSAPDDEANLDETKVNTVSTRLKPSKLVKLLPEIAKIVLFA